LKTGTMQLTSASRRPSVSTPASYSERFCA
jgi:hypothetical protein